MRLNLKRALEAAGFLVEQTASGREALSLLESNPYTGIVVDVDMDEPDGVLFMMQARNIQPELLIIILTAQPTLRSAVAAIKAGATDYILKPTSITTVTEAITSAIQKKMNQKGQLWELVQNILHSDSERGNMHSLSSALDASTRNHILIVRPLRLDRARRLVTFIDNPRHTMRLSRGETAVLSSLMLSPDQPIPIQHIAHQAWNYALEPDEAKRLIRPYIFRLRQKLEAKPEKPKLILTVPRQGYLFVSSQHLQADMPSKDSI
jgi:DNA-binding response OmpR family regulator